MSGAAFCLKTITIHSDYVKKYNISYDSAYDSNGLPILVRFLARVNSFIVIVVTVCPSFDFKT